MTRPAGLRQNEVLVEVDDGVAWLTLNRPAALNAMTEQMHGELADACAYITGDTAVRIAVLTGAGERAFCIGSDLAFLDEAFASQDLDRFAAYLHRLNTILTAVEELPVPTIAMVRGRARASGFELLLCCDLVLVAEQARVGDVHTPYGHMPGGGATQRAVRKLGWQRGLELLCTGRWLTGAEAVAYGLALRAVPDAKLRDETGQLAGQLAAHPGTCLRYLKQAALAGRDAPLRDGLQAEIDTYLAYLQHDPVPRELFLARRAAATAG
jgi:2-(1,2-epoxy-1,2-dihydrophenyl)acetyl-CoA isomerase/putative hydratase